MGSLHSATLIDFSILEVPGGVGRHLTGEPSVTDVSPSVSAGSASIIKRIITRSTLLSRLTGLRGPSSVGITASAGKGTVTGRDLVTVSTVVGLGSVRVVIMAGDGTGVLSELGTSAGGLPGTVGRPSTGRELVTGSVIATKPGDGPPGVSSTGEPAD